MLRIGDAAPTFDCTAALGSETVHLSWNQVHKGKTLILVFDSIEDAEEDPGRLASLSRAAGRFEYLQCHLAIVCPDELFEILSWTDHLAAEMAPSAIDVPVIADSDGHIASLYEMLSAEGLPLWGHVIANSLGKVRSIDVNSIRMGVNVDELLRFALSIAVEERVTRAG